nr:nucleotidyltransferase family protein [Microbacterium ureisolvens]
MRLGEAVELGYAWVQRAATGRGIRVLFIKGPALHRQGLRDERVSADIDVLVDPARFAELCDAVAEGGWRERPGNFLSARTTLHSRTYVRDGWPCDLDVHSHFPGFLADTATVFDALWARREHMPFAHHDCDVPDRIGAMLILALHSLRSARTQRRHADELEQLLRVELTDEERADAASLALTTGSAATLEAVLPRLGIELEPPAGELQSEALREWRLRVAAGAHGAYFWLLAFRRAPWKERPAIVWRAWWPTRRDLLVARPLTVDTVRGRTGARLARWSSGVRFAPAAMRALWAHGRPVRSSASRRRGVDI